MDKQDCASFLGREKVRSSVSRPCLVTGLLTGGKVPSSSTSKAASQSPGRHWVVCDSFFSCFLHLWNRHFIWHLWRYDWTHQFGGSLSCRQHGLGNIGNKGNTSLTNNMTISVRLYCIHFRKDIGKSIHLYSVHVAGVQQLDVLNLIKIVFKKIHDFTMLPDQSNPFSRMVQLIQSQSTWVIYLQQMMQGPS